MNLDLAGRLRCRPHGGSPGPPLPVPQGTDLDLFPCSRGAPEAVMNIVIDTACRLLTFDVSGEEVDYTLQCVSRAWWRSISRWHDIKTVRHNDEWWLVSGKCIMCQSTPHECSSVHDCMTGAKKESSQEEIS